MFGNIVLIGELFLVRLLRQDAIWECFRYLQEIQTDDGIDALVRLLWRVGKVMENNGENLARVFGQLHTVQDRLPKRLQFLVRGIHTIQLHSHSDVTLQVQELVDFRQSGWHQRRRAR